MSSKLVIGGMLILLENYGRNISRFTYGLPIFQGELVEKTFRIDPVKCEGCGLCHHFCNHDAIKYGEFANGKLYETLLSISIRGLLQKSEMPPIDVGRKRIRR